jgi:hypothetical protein
MSTTMKFTKQDGIPFFAIVAIMALILSAQWNNHHPKPAAGSGTYLLSFGIPATLSTTGSTPLQLNATPLTGTYHFQGINEGAVDAFVSFDGEQTTPTYGFKVPASSANCPTYTITLNNSNVLLSRGSSSSNVTGFSLSGY